MKLRVINHKKYNGWHKWFAWHPVYVFDDDNNMYLVCFRYIWRKHTIALSSGVPVSHWQFSFSYPLQITINKKVS